MPDPSTDRPDNREVENENLKPAGDGRPPRPATAGPRLGRADGLVFRDVLPARAS